MGSQMRDAKWQIRWRQDEEDVAVESYDHNAGQHLHQQESALWDQLAAASLEDDGAGQPVLPVQRAAAQQAASMLLCKVRSCRAPLRVEASVRLTKLPSCMHLPQVTSPLILRNDPSCILAS